MKPLLIALSLALAAVAIPNASAQEPTVPEVPEKPLQCTFYGGDTDCRAEEGPCEAHVHLYDVEDALNTYEAYCFDCGIHIGGGPFVQCPLIGPTAAAAPDLPFETHCWATPDGTGCTTTFDLGVVICNYTSGNWDGFQQAWLECSTLQTGSCTVGILPVQDPPVVWCENYGPGGSSASSAEFPPQPCTTGIAQTWCDFTVGPCDVRVVPWTAWGDRYVVSDCQGGGAGPTCHTEVHTLPPDHQHYCAFSQAAPCTFSPPAHVGFDCTVGRVHCAFFIWVDLNPPNPTWDCL